MPLVTTERSAVQILMALLERGEGGLQSFARTVLGAHSDQAKRLATMAVNGELPDDPQEDITVSKEIEGQELSVTLRSGKLPIRSYEDLVTFYKIDTTRWQPTQQQFSFWGSEDKPNFSVKAVFKESEYRALTDEDRARVRDMAAEYAPDWSKIEQLQPDPKGNLLEIVISDLHADAVSSIGTSLETRLRTVEAGVFNILHRAQRQGVSRVALVFLGDTFNHDGTGATSNGTPQENNHESRDAYLKVKAWIAGITSAIAEAYTVDVYVMEGNHDQERTFYAVDSLSGFFHHHPNVRVSPNTRRAHIDWGQVLIGLWHGERQKNTDIAMTLLRDFPAQGKRFLEVHLGHEHTRREDEINGVLIRRFRSPSSESDWADRKLMKHNIRSITGILWNRDRGEIASFPATFFERT